MEHATWSGVSYRFPHRRDMYWAIAAPNAAPSVIAARVVGARQSCAISAVQGTGPERRQVSDPQRRRCWMMNDPAEPALYRLPSKGNLGGGLTRDRDVRRCVRPLYDEQGRAFASNRRGVGLPAVLLERTPRDRLHALGPVVLATLQHFLSLLDHERAHYMRSGDPDLHYRYFILQNKLNGSVQYTVGGPGIDGLDWSGVKGMTEASGGMYWQTDEGARDRLLGRRACRRYRQHGRQSREPGLKRALILPS